MQNGVVCLQNGCFVLQLDFMFYLRMGVLIELKTVIINERYLALQVTYSGFAPFGFQSLKCLYPLMFFKCTNVY